MIKQLFLNCLALSFLAIQPTFAQVNRSKELSIDLDYLVHKDCYVAFEDVILPVIPMLAASFKYTNNQDKKIIKQSFEAALNRGCSVNVSDPAGLTALNQAILYNNLALAQLVLNRGADPYQQIELTGMEGRMYHFKDSFELLKRLKDVAPNVDRSEIESLLISFKKTK